MRFLQTLFGVIVTVGLIYLAFIVGGFVLRVLFGLLAIGVVVLVVMSLLRGRGRRRGAP